MIKAFLDLCPVNPENAHLLGTPIGGEEGIHSSIHEKVRALQHFDDLLRSLLGEITNANIANDDAAWTQASLPVGSGGL